MQLASEVEEVSAEWAGEDETHFFQTPIGHDVHCCSAASAAPHLHSYSAEEMRKRGWVNADGTSWTEFW